MTISGRWKKLDYDVLWRFMAFCGENPSETEFLWES
jgi:hypothetical protein